MFSSSSGKKNHINTKKKKRTNLAFREASFLLHHLQAFQELGIILYEVSRVGMRSPTHPWGVLPEPSAPVSWERRRFPGIFGVFLGLEFEPDAPGGFCILFRIQSQLPLGWGREELGWCWFGVVFSQTGEGGILGRSCGREGSWWPQIPWKVPGRSQGHRCCHIPPAEVLGSNSNRNPNPRRRFLTLGCFLPPLGFSR